MIQRLRRNFVLIMMSIVLIILLAVFIAVLSTTRSNLRRTSLEALWQSVREEPGFHEEFRQGVGPQGEPKGEDFQNGGLKRFPNMRTPTLVLVLDAAGEVQVLANHIYLLGDDAVQELAALAHTLGGESGTLSDYSLRYLRKENADGSMRIAFADITLENAVLRDLIITSLLIGAGALLLFLALSIFLARWAVRPVQQAWDRQRRFVADASHELKTPLTVILSNADMLANSTACADEKEARRLENIRAEGNRMKRLIGDLLTLARTDNAPDPVFCEVDLSDIVSGCVLLYEPMGFDCGKHLEADIQEGVIVRGDPERLRRLTDCLLDNALKYCPSGGGIRISLRETGRKSARLTVRNDGEPLPAEELSRIFERFYRVDQARLSHGGFGLGLSIASGIVREHGGKIWAESDAGGNLFHVTLPM